MEIYVKMKNQGNYNLIKCQTKRAVCKLRNDIYRCKIIILILIIYGIVSQIAFGMMCPFKILTGWDCPGCGLTRGCMCDRICI